MHDKGHMYNGLAGCWVELPCLRIMRWWEELVQWGGRWAGWGENWEKTEWMAWRVLIWKLMSLKDYEQKMGKVMFKEDYSSCASECMCLWVCVHTSMHVQEVVQSITFPSKADVDGKNQGMELVVLTSTLFTFLFSRALTKELQSCS